MRIWKAVGTKGTPRKMGAVGLALWMLFASSSAVRADGYCDLVLEIEIKVASAIGTKRELQAQWMPVAEQLSKSSPRLEDPDAHHDLIVALLNGSFESALDALRNMRTAIPGCFELETPADQVSVDAGEEGSSAYGGAASGGSVMAQIGTFVANNPVAVASGLSTFTLFVGICIAFVVVALRRSLWRRAPRFSCTVPASLSAPNSKGEGAVVNINAYGAQVQRFDLDAEVGDTIKVGTKLFETSGEVMWANPHFMGLRFHNPIEDSKVEEAVQFSSPRSDDDIDMGEDGPPIEFRPRSRPAD